MRVPSFLKPAVFVVLLVMCPAVVFGQATRSVSNVGRRIDDFQRQADKAARDSMNREMRGRKPTKEELREAARIKEETREDLEGLQDAYNEIVAKLNAEKGALEPEFVSQAAERVNKHANRLKTNIVFPKGEDPPDEQEKPSTADDRVAIRSLCEKIYLFLSNPMIENPQVLDLESAASARILLDSVISISESLARK